MSLHNYIWKNCLKRYFKGFGELTKDVAWQKHKQIINNIPVYAHYCSISSSHNEIHWLQCVAMVTVYDWLMSHYWQGWTLDKMRMMLLPLLLFCLRLLNWYHVSDDMSYTCQWTLIIMYDISCDVSYDKSHDMSYVKIILTSNCCI